MKKSIPELLKKTLLHAAFMAGSAVMIVPFLWMMFTSFKPKEEVLSWPPVLLPQQWTFENYIGIFEAWPFEMFFINSLAICTVSTLSIIATSVLAGYVFAKHEFLGKKYIFSLILITIMIPIQVYIVPLYINMAKLNLVNTYLGIVFPILIQSFGIFFMRQNIASIPDDYLDAARMDGCSEFRIVASVVFPLAKPAMSALAIFAFMHAWSNFIWPLIITNSVRKYVLEVGLALFQHRFFIDYASTTAGAFLAVIPVVIVFLLFRRNIIEGVTLSGMKS